MSAAVRDRRPEVVATGRRFAFPTEKAFLSQAVLLEESGPPRAPAFVCLLGFAFVATAVLASALIQIDVVTSTSGQIVASDGHQILQSFDGGLIDHIDVEEGQVVASGDLLMTLKNPEAEAQLDRLSLREAPCLPRQGASRPFSPCPRHRRSCSQTRHDLSPTSSFRSSISSAAPSWRKPPSPKRKSIGDRACSPMSAPSRTMPAIACP